MADHGSLDNATSLLILVLGIFILKLAYSVKEEIMLTSHCSLQDFFKVERNQGYKKMCFLYPSSIVIFKIQSNC